MRDSTKVRVDLHLNNCPKGILQKLLHPFRALETGTSRGNPVQYGHVGMIEGTFIVGFTHAIARNFMYDNRKTLGALALVYLTNSCFCQHRDHALSVRHGFDRVWMVFRDL